MPSIEEIARRLFALKEMKGYVLVLSIGIETSRLTFKSYFSTFSYSSA